jgi:hypothetical protein
LWWEGQAGLGDERVEVVDAAGSQVAQAALEPSVGFNSGA